MNDSEKRRRELLRQTRKLYDERNTVPAVHPRYGHIFNDLYGEEEATQPKNSFYLRAVVGILCFVCYVCMDTNQIKVAEVDSAQIVNQIEKEMDTSVLEEVWKEL